MIDINHDAMTAAERAALMAFFARLHRGLCAEGKMSELVRVWFGDFRVDFRIKYLGPSRKRREARRPRMTPTKEK